MYATIHIRLFICLCLCLTFYAAAQGEQAQQTQGAQAVSGDLAEIRFEGISNPTTQSLVRVRLVARPGTPVERINLEAERNRILGLGTFSQVRVSLEPGENGPVLVVSVEENPPIAEVEIEGSSLPVDRLKEFLAESLIEAETTYNTFRAREGIEILQAIYNQNGFPGTVPVTLDIVPVDPNEAPSLLGEDNEEQDTEQDASEEDAEDTEANETEADEDAPSATDEEIAEAEAVRLVYTINESPPLDEVTFSGATVLTEERLRELFRPLTRAEDFDPRAYNAAVQAVADAYEEQGYRGSGVNPRTTVLENGTLDVEVQELSILSFDTTAVGIDASALSLERGDLYNYDALLDDIQRLAAERSQDIRIEPTVTENGGVRVTFESGPPESAGPIDSIDIEGNTVFTDERLLEALRLNVGDTFTSAAAEDDFRRLLDLYTNEGYLLVTPPELTYPDGTNVFNYVDGAYVQRLREVKITGYEVNLQEENPRTDDDVITRYLPEVGTVYNQREVERGILEINRLNIVQLTQVGGRISHALVPASNPDEVIVRFIATEQPARTIRPSAELATEGGVSFGAEVSYIDANLFGEAHRLSTSLGAQTSDIGFQLNGNISYDIPWLYIDFLDFKEVPTELNIDLFSDVQNNQPLTEDGERKVCVDDFTQDCGDEEKVFIGEYSQRDTGLRFGIGRPVLENTSVRLTGRFTSTRYTLEPSSEPCEFDEDGNVVDNTCSLNRDEDDPGTEANREFTDDAKPQNGFSSFVGVSSAYDTRDNPEFPRSGYRFTASTGLGFGNDFQQDGQQRSYTYQPVEFGARTYVALSNPSHVFAFRLNAGHQFGFGGDYPESRYFIVGDTNNEATQLRGYTREDIDPSRTYAVGTAEYRYDFGLATPVTQTIVGIAFTDVGYASDLGGNDDNFAEPLLFSAGVGLQLNIGFGGALALPPLRFDYGFSPANPTGTFGFRLGFNF